MLEIPLMSVLLGLKLYISEPPKITPLQERKLYLYEAVEYDYKKFKLLDRLIEVESNWNHEARNPTTNAKGYFQILDYWWKEEAEKLGLDYENSWEDNLDMGLHILEVQGLNAWQPSIEKL